MARRKNIAIEVAVASPFTFEGRDPVAPETYTRSQSSPNVDWEGLYGAGENSNGFRATNPNGTLSDHGNGHNQTFWSSDNRGNGQRFGERVNWNKNGRANRTGE